MKLQNIKKGFYTDGEKIYSCEMGKAAVWLPCREESERWLASGNEPARCHDDIEVKPVKEGMTFCDGQITVIDKHTIKYRYVEAVNAQYDNKGYCIKFDGYKNLMCKYKN